MYCTFCMEILIKKGIAESNSFSWVCWGNAQPFSNLPKYIRGILGHMRVAVCLQQFKVKVRLLLSDILNNFFQETFFFFF